MQASAAPSSFVAFAEAMKPRLAARAQAAEDLRRLPGATVAEAAEAGFFGMVVPRRWGGAQAEFPEFLDVVRRLSHACPSSAWTLSFLALHAWMLCRFEPELQAELFAGGGIPLAPAPLAPTGQAIKVDGGFRVTGRWEWATGVMHADWVIVNCLEQDAFGPRFCVLPIADVEVEDVWRTAGMCATGSNMIVARDVFVPDRRTLEGWRVKAGQTPGEALHPGTSVPYPMTVALGLVAATPALGAAEGALEVFTARMKEKMQAYSGQKAAEVPATHLRLGEALAIVRAARLVWNDAVARLERIGPQGAAAGVEDLCAIRLAAADVVRLSHQAINGLAAAAGASSGFLTSPLQRHLRDVQMMRGHVMFDWDRAAQLGGKVALGYEPGLADLL